MLKSSFLINVNAAYFTPREHPEIEYLDYPNVQVAITSGGESIYNLDVTTPYPSMSAVVPSPSVVYNSSSSGTTTTTQAASTTVSALPEKEGLAGWAISFIVIIVVTVLCCIAFGGMYYLEKKDSHRTELDDNGDRSRSSGKKMSFFDLDDQSQARSQAWSQARSQVSSQMSSKKQKKQKRISSSQRKIGSQGSVASNDSDSSSAKESFADSRSHDSSSRNHRIPRDPTMYLDYIAEDQAYVDESHDFYTEQQEQHGMSKSLSSQRSYTSQESQNSRNSRIKDVKQSTRMSSSIFSQESGTTGRSSRHTAMGSARNSADVSVTSSRSSSSFNGSFL